VLPSTAKRKEGAIDLTGLSYIVDRSGTDPVAVLTGEIDVATIDALEAAIAATEQDSASAEVVLDMTAVTFLDSSGLRVLITAHDRLDTAARRLVIRRPPAAVLRVFEITGLLSTFVIDD
jgi:anti-anti-sigma factor